MSRIIGNTMWILRINYLSMKVLEYLIKKLIDIVRKCIKEQAFQQRIFYSRKNYIHLHSLTFPQTKTGYLIINEIACKR